MSHKKKHSHESHKIRNTAVIGILGLTAWLGYQTGRHGGDHIQRPTGLPAAEAPGAQQGIKDGKYTTIRVNDKHGSVWGVAEATLPHAETSELLDLVNNIQFNELGGSSLVHPGDEVVVPNTPAAHALHEQQKTNPDA